MITPLGYLLALVLLLFILAALSKCTWQWATLFYSVPSGPLRARQDLLNLRSFPAPNIPAPWPGTPGLFEVATYE